MARVNIEDSIFRDPRWNNLIIKTGCRFKAMGLLSWAWIIAQENWTKHKSIPQKAWSKEMDPLIEVELAERLPDGNVYMKGSKKAFAWLTQKSESGKSKSPAKLKALDVARKQRLSKNSLNGPERNVNGDRTGLNGSEPLTLTLTPTLNNNITSSLVVEVPEAKTKQVPDAELAPLLLRLPPGALASLDFQFDRAHLTKHLRDAIAYCDTKGDVVGGVVSLKTVQRYLRIARDNPAPTKAVPKQRTISEMIEAGEV